MFFLKKGLKSKQKQEFALHFYLEYNDGLF